MAGWQTILIFLRINYQTQLIFRLENTPVCENVISLPFDRLGTGAMMRMRVVGEKRSIFVLFTQQCRPDVDC